MYEFAVANSNTLIMAVLGREIGEEEKGKRRNERRSRRRRRRRKRRKKRRTKEKEKKGEEEEGEPGPEVDDIGFEEFYQARGRRTHNTLR